MAREVHFRPSLFNYENTTVDTKQLTNLGFSGFKLFMAPEPGQTRRGVVPGRQLLPRGGRHGPVRLVGPRPGDRYLRQKREEFPDFTKFWFETPDKDSTRFVVYALLDSPSATGAYRFDIDCQAERVVMEVDANVNARTAIEQLALHR